ncbi:MAG: cytochrome c oxidase assembly protein [Stellaceae bacterium]
MTGQGKTVLGLVAVLLAMGGLTVASVPLYRIFCAATGYAGTTQRAKAAPAHAVKNRIVTVRFDASRASDLPWDFAPEQREIQVHPGEENVIYYRATNRSAQGISGRAAYNVTPDKAGLYFDKLQCFCFSDQYLAPGQSARLSVQFFVDPGIVKDPNTHDVDTITLSYTMFRAKDADDAAAETAAARPDLN